MSSLLVEKSIQMPLIGVSLILIVTVIPDMCNTADMYANTLSNLSKYEVFHVVEVELLIPTFSLAIIASLFVHIFLLAMGLIIAFLGIAWPSSNQNRRLLYLIIFLVGIGISTGIIITNTDQTSFLARIGGILLSAVFSIIASHIYVKEIIQDLRNQKYTLTRLYVYIGVSLVVIIPSIGVVGVTEDIKTESVAELIAVAKEMNVTVAVIAEAADMAETRISEFTRLQIMAEIFAAAFTPLLGSILFIMTAKENLQL